MRPSLLDAAIFSAKAFAGAMLALYIAFRLDLDRPYWAMATAYIVAQPLTGATRSKAMYRFLGTLLGAVAAVALVPNLSQAPVLLTLAFALWTGACLYLALLDRTPRSYMFMLAGYTAAIIGLPGVGAPDAIFDTALARVEEITLGIACTALVGSIVLPRPIGPVLNARVDAWLNDAAQWALDAFAGQGMPAERRRLAADAAEIDTLATHLAYDPSNRERATRWVGALRQRILMLLPVISSIADRVAALRQADAVPADLGALLADLASWLRAGGAAPREDADRLRAAIRRLEATANGPEWREIVLGSLLVRLREFVDILQDAREIRRHIAAGGGRRMTQRLRFHPRAGAATLRHRDHGMALLSGLSAALAVCIVCVFWIGAAWPEGAVAAEMAAVACCFFAAQDDPVPAILSFLRNSVIALALDAVYLFAVLPTVQDFPTLVAVLALAFLPLGMMIAIPATYGTGMAVAVNGATLLSLQGSYNVDAAAFLNGGIALVVGMAAAAAVTRLVRSVGAEWSAGRLLQAAWRDLAAAASPRGQADRAGFAGLMLDRLGLLAPRLAVAAPGADVAAADLLADLRTGLNIVDLQRQRRTLGPAEAALVGDVLDGVAAHFRACAAARRPEPPAPALLPRLDRAIDTVGAMAPGARRRQVLLRLGGIRRALFPDAPYRPGTPPAIPQRMAA